MKNEQYEDINSDIDVSDNNTGTYQPPTQHLNTNQQVVHVNPPINAQPMDNREGKVSKICEFVKDKKKVIIGVVVVILAIVIIAAIIDELD